MKCNTCAKPIDVEKAEKHGDFVICPSCRNKNNPAEQDRTVV